jgi:hypothetical protein
MKVGQTHGKTSSTGGGTSHRNAAAWRASAQQTDVPMPWRRALGWAPGLAALAAPSACGVLGPDRTSPSTAPTLTFTHTAEESTGGSLRFRPVLKKMSPPCGPGTVKYTADDESACFELADGFEVRTINADVEQHEGVEQFYVSVQLGPAETKQFRDMSARLVSMLDPQNRFALVVDDKIISAPVMQAIITDGQMSIDGGYDREAAEHLARQIEAGAGKVERRGMVLQCP